MAVNPETTVRKLFSLPRTLLREVDDFRSANSIGAESEAVRRLIRLGLEFQREREVQGPRERSDAA